MHLALVCSTVFHQLKTLEWAFKKRLFPLHKHRLGFDDDDEDLTMTMQMIVFRTTLILWCTKHSSSCQPVTQKKVHSIVITLFFTPKFCEVMLRWVIFVWPHVYGQQKTSRASLERFWQQVKWYVQVTQKLYANAIEKCDNLVQFHGLLTLNLHDVSAVKCIWHLFDQQFSSIENFGIGMSF